MIAVVDFFCGCGGTSAGLRDSGMKILAGIDNDSDAGRTFARNFPEAEFFLTDIRDSEHLDLKSVLPETRVRPLLFSACAPCQPFTKQRTTRDREDQRASLLDAIHPFIKEFKPCYIFVENVAGIQKVDRKTATVGRFIELLDRLQYKHNMGILKAQDFGVPQHRRRFVLLASLLGPIKLPEATHGPGTANPELESAWKWIKDLPSLEAGQHCKKYKKYKNHCAANLSQLNLERIRATPPDCGRESWPEHLRLNCHNNYQGHTDVYGRLRKDRPAAALTTRCISLSNGRYGHPEQNRALSVREAARLQTFADKFEFFGSMGSMARQIGNAVPVKLANAIGKHVLRHMAACQASTK